MLSKLKSFGLSGKLTGAGGGGFAFALVPPGCLCFVCCFVFLFVALVLFALVPQGCLCFFCYLFVCLFVVLVLFAFLPPGCLPIFDSGLMHI